MSKKNIVLKNKQEEIAMNVLLQNKILSFKARGLFKTMWDLSDKTNITEEFLAQQAKDGLKSVQSGLKELEQHGYLIRRQLKDDEGKYTQSTCYELYL